MTDSRPNALGRALRGLLADNLPRVRGLSRHTICSFRDALKLLLVFYGLDWDQIARWDLQPQTARQRLVSQVSSAFPHRIANAPLSRT